MARAEHFYFVKKKKKINFATAQIFHVILVCIHILNKNALLLIFFAVSITENKTSPFLIPAIQIC